MLKTDFWALPIKLIEVSPSGGLGYAAPKIEGESYVRSWESPDGRDWWSETIDGVRYRRAYAEKAE
jgi:hypothetical protein